MQRSFLGQAARLTALRPRALRQPRALTVSADAERVFASFDVYKGKAALSVKPIQPTFTSLGQDKGFEVKNGALMFEFANSVGSRQYDWNTKVVFAASVSELGELLAFKAAGMAAEASLSWTHDPAKGGADEGKNIKSLRISLAPDGKAVFLNVSQTGGTTSKVTIPLTFGEFAVLTELASYAIPRLLGFDRALTSYS